MSYCVQCHNGPPAPYADWLKSPHGNFNYYNSDTTALKVYTDFLASFTYPNDYTLFTGHPNSTTIAQMLATPAYTGKNSKYCLTCHGPSTSDNNAVARMPLVDSNGYIDADNMSQIARPVAGCEVCHGGGKNHIKNPLSVAMSIKLPSAAQCGTCHSNDFPAGHLTDFPQGAGGVNNPGIYEAYLTSPHANSKNSAIYANSKRTLVTPLCSKCHTDQGAREFVDRDGDSTTLPTLFTGEANLSKTAAIQCRTCHDAHDSSKLLEPATAATDSKTARSAEFNTCTNCHQLLDDNDAVIAPMHTDAAMTITDTHFDNPATEAIEGYNIDRASDTACSNCHNPHQANNTINTQWTASGHADMTGLAWEEEGGLAASRSCKRCHTTTGYVERLADPVAYDASSTPVAQYVTGSQKEMLYCNACHSDSSFSRRTFTNVAFPSGYTADMGDDSNLCMGCHQGRSAGSGPASGTSVLANKVATPAPGGYTFTNIHYFAAAASLFGSDVKGGYEYAGREYEGKNLFSAHNGRRDTCIKCHLREGKAEYPDHRMSPQISDCSACHGGITDFKDIRPSTYGTDYDGDSSATEGLYYELEGLRTALLTAIQTYALNSNTVQHLAIGYDGNTNPYWFKDTNLNGTIETDEAVTGNRYNKFDARLLEAAYNYQVSTKEPCGHIHNFKYMGQLLYDSIEDLGGNVSGFTRP